MKAKLIENSAPGGQRQKLSDLIPLQTPLVVQFQPTTVCNFRCKYCSFSLPSYKQPFISNQKFMDFELFKKGINDLTLFPNKIKTLRLAGLGEHLLHSDVSKMIDYVTIKNIAEKTEISTNGVLLNNKMSDDLISAKLSRLVISIQGLTTEKYIEVCNRNIDINKLIDNIKYFYEHKINTHIHIKIVDIALNNDFEKNKFFEMFGDICDTIGIENAVPIHPNLPLNEELEKNNKGMTQYGNHVKEVSICPVPFYLMHILPDGKVMPCCAFEFPKSIGDLNFNSLYEIWNGKKFTNFRREMLNGNKSMGKVCSNCELHKYRFFDEDYLDNDKEKLNLIYE